MLYLRLVDLDLAVNLGQLRLFLHVEIIFLVAAGNLLTLQLLDCDMNPKHLCEVNDFSKVDGPLLDLKDT